MKMCMGAIAGAFIGSTVIAQPEIEFGSVSYEKLETRAATEARMIQLLQNLPDVEWGPWSICAPFVGSERGMLVAPRPPEAELARMNHNGPGPDLSATYEGKNGTVAAWRSIGVVDNERIRFSTFEDPALNNQTTGYLYRRVECTKAVDYPVTMGSDDGLRLWVNGTLLIDADVPRGLNAEAHKLTLHFEPGVNHILVKVTQGGGGWEYQLNTSMPLAADVDAKLRFVLDRDFPSRERSYYPVATIPVPEDIVLEVGGMDVLPDGRAIVCTRRGDVYIIENAESATPFSPRFVQYASGLHEPLGLEVRVEEKDGKEIVAVYCVQRGELTRMVDEDGDDRADLFETFSDGWGVSGNYHEFSFGPKFDADGNAWVTLNVGFCGALGKSIVPLRGWALKITPDGEVIPVCGGLRSPNGLGFNQQGDAFYVDNQGDYVGTCKLSWLKEDSYHGHIAGLRWYDDYVEGETDRERIPPAIWFPYRKMGQSTADVVLCDEDGKFGPWDGQLFCGDQWSATVMRVSLEMVDGVYQGACFPFAEDFDCGVNRMAFAPDGSMLVGETNRGWGSLGRRPYGIQKMTWSGVVPFEVLDMKVTPDGFELTFTQDVDVKSAGDTASYTMQSYTYEYHPQYGSDEMERQQLRIVRAEVVNARKVRLVVESLRFGGEGYVHELHMPGVVNTEGETLLHDEAYYTLNRLPQE